MKYPPSLAWGCTPRLHRATYEGYDPDESLFLSNTKKRINFAHDTPSKGECPDESGQGGCFSWFSSSAG